MAKKKGVPMVYKCQVWWCSGHARDRLEDPVPSDAYGVFQEHDNLHKAMTDKVALQLTSRKGAFPDGAFFVTVIEYPKGYPPATCRREIYDCIGGGDG